MNSEATAVVMGRWQIYHKGHQTLMNKALSGFGKVIVVIGSAFHARDTVNPFNWEERKAMISSTLTLSELERVSFFPVRDYYDDDRWNEAVSKGVSAIAGTSPITIIGFEKDHSSYYLDNFPQWGRLDVGRGIDIDATPLRNVYFESESAKASFSVMAHYLSTPVLSYLQSWRFLADYKQRSLEHIAVKEYKLKWPNTSLTADAVIVVRDNLLLQRRAGVIGYGLWALPGGFVDPNEPVYSAAVREADEETGFKQLPSTMRAAFKGKEMFAHPRRSARGRLVTEAQYFNFGTMKIPEVFCNDGEALECGFFPISSLRSFESKTFEDHDHIIEHFLGPVIHAN